MRRSKPRMSCAVFVFSPENGQNFRMGSILVDMPKEICTGKVLV
ncbi:hypothetical protein [Desulfosporosinus acididurans]|nr:hypothetical protein [Desulfosporosinus acididurans]